MNPSRLGQEGPRMGKVLNLHPAGFEVLEVQRAELRKRDTGMADVCLTSSWVGQAGGQNAKGKFWWWEDAGKPLISGLIFFSFVVGSPASF